MKNSLFQKIVAGVFLISLWVYQLPESRMERVLRTIFRPIQKIMMTDRMYRMYAPDPRVSKRLPFLELKTEQSPVRFLKTPPGRGFGLTPIFAREKWANFIDQMARALRDERFFISTEEGEAMFRRLSERICLSESREGDRVKSVILQDRHVSYGEFRGDIVWEEPEVLESYLCQ